MSQHGNSPEHTTLTAVEQPWHPFSVAASLRDGRRVIKFGGELDFSARDVVYDACVVDDDLEVTVDLHGIEFMDCSGYSALVAARHELESRGGSLMWEHPTGEPARFLDLISELELSKPPVIPKRR